MNYMAPLSRQTDFFVPEMKEEVKTDVKEEDSDEDRGTDITGKYCSAKPSLGNTVSGDISRKDLPLKQIHRRAADLAEQLRLELPVRSK